jgi:hypothetical protein
VFAALAALGLAHRLLLMVYVGRGSSAPPPEVRSLLAWDVLAGWPEDIALAALVGLGVGLAGSWRAPTRLAGAVAPPVILLTLGCVFAAHNRLLLAMQSGLTAELVTEGFAGFTLAALPAYVGRRDLLLALSPLAFYWAGVALVPARWLLVLPIAGLAATLPVSLARHSTNETIAAYRGNPVRFVLADALASHQSATPTIRAARVVVPGAPLGPPAALNRPRNVVLVILESTGVRRAFGPDPLDPAMPFLRALATRSLELRNHHATGNNSPSAIFSLLSGLYPDPRSAGLGGARGDLALPSLRSHLAPGTDAFLVSPGGLDHFFPRRLLEDDHWEVHDFTNLFTRGPDPEPTESEEDARNEAEVVGFFIGRVHAARAPFLAVYSSFAPHWPYPDLGPGQRLYADAAQALQRHLNGLALLDRQLERIYGALQQDGLLDDTILVVVGDHGEAFGDHPGNWIHSRASYEENLKVPALVHQPRLVAPSAIERPTSHVDVLPTIMDLLGRPYDPGALQGRSVLRVGPPRVTFGVGAEKALVAWDESSAKIDLSLKRDACRAFDLGQDPGEQKPLACSGFPQLQAALVEFRETQGALLEERSRVFRMPWVRQGVRRLTKPCSAVAPRNCGAAARRSRRSKRRGRRRRGVPGVGARALTASSRRSRPAREPPKAQGVSSDASRSR